MSKSNPVKEPSYSQKLRTIFYKLWQKEDEGFVDFEEYYESKMEKLINHYNKML